MNQKEITWAKIAQQVDTIKDGLGKGIEIGIKEAVIAINAFGINTTMSCEGHFERGVAGPWVDIDIQETEEIKKLRDDLRSTNEISKDKEKDRDKLNKEELEKLYKLWDESHKLEDRLEKITLPESKKIFNLLSEFYKNRSVDFDQMLALNFSPFGGSRLMCQGTRLQEVMSPEEKADNLRRYQGEMRLFTEFLKKKYFQDQ